MNFKNVVISSAGMGLFIAGIGSIVEAGQDFNWHSILGIVLIVVGLNLWSDFRE